MSPTLTLRHAALLACLPAALAACRRSSDDRPDAPSTPIVASMRPANAPPQPLGAGDVRIVTADSGVDLALLGDSISTGLSQHTLEKVRRETDTAAVTGNGFGASIDKLVKSTVASAIGTRVAFPLSAVKDVRYEGGTLKFDWVGKPLNIFTNSKEHGRPVLASFPPADAQRFVDAVRARKAQRASAP